MKNMSTKLALLMPVASTFLVVVGMVAEAGVPIGFQEPTGQEQLFAYDLNRARNDPGAYGREANITDDLSGLAVRPPLAMNLNLVGSARFHSQEMEGDDHEYFAHVTPGCRPGAGDDPLPGVDACVGPNKRAVEHGYDLFGNGLDPSIWTSQNFIESIALGINQTRTSPEALQQLIEDEGVVPKGHRIHLLATVAAFAEHNEVGVGVATGKVADRQGVPSNFNGRPEFLYSIHTGFESLNNTFLTGVIFDDKNRNGRYDDKEGVGGVPLQIAGPGGDINILSWGSGGYSQKVAAGDYIITVNGGAFQGVSVANVTVGAENVEVDFASGLGVGEVNFEFRDTGPPPPPPPPPPPAVFELQKAKGKLSSKTQRWAIKAKGLYNPGLSQYDGSVNDFIVEIDGVVYFGGDANQGAKVKTKLDKVTGLIVKFTVKQPDKDVLKVDFSKNKLTIVAKNISKKNINYDDGTSFVLRVQNSTATLNAPTQIVGNKALLTPTVGEVQPIGE